MKIYDKSPLRNNVLSPALKVSYVLGASPPTPLTLNFNFPRSFISLLKYGIAAICSGIIGYFLIQIGTVKIDLQHKKQVFNMDNQSVYHDALAWAGFSYYDLGQTMGQIVTKILQDVKASKIPTTMTPNRALFLNLASAEKLGIRIPTDMVNKAKYVIGEGEAG